MTWNAPPARSSRSTRPTYLPPHLRNPTSSPYRFNGSPNRGRTGDIPMPEDKFDDLETEEDIVTVSAYDDVPVNVSGDNIPNPVAAFSEMGFCKELSDNIKRCKYVKPTPIQRYAIPAAMDGRDLMACAQTGSGKTAAFCFPIISRIFSETRSRVAAGARGFRYSRNIACPLALILSPTRELSCQIHDEAKKFSYLTGLKVAVVYGGAPAIPQLRILEKGVDILVATPGRLVDMIEKSRVSLHEVKYLALDEADRMLDMGFEPQVRRIVQQMKMPPPGRRQTMLFSATFPTEIQKLASDFLSNYIFLAAGKVGSSTDLIVQKVEFVHDSDKKDHLRDLLQAQIPGVTDPKLALTLVFVETKKGADALEHWLIRSGFPSIAIHGDKVQMERERALKSFRSGHTPILVATDVAARGLDIPHVAHVINFDLPRNIDDYVHRIGRTGRAGKSGVATAFFSDKNAPVAKDLVEVMQGANQEIPKWLSEYAETSLSGNGTRTTNRSGRTKFGGHDYRNAYSETCSGNAAASPCYDASGNPFTYGAPFAAPYYFPPQGESFPASPYGYNYAPTEIDSFPATAQNNYSFDYATVAATGWD